jgi:hypothetical protein
VWSSPGITKPLFPISTTARAISRALYCSRAHAGYADQVPSGPGAPCGDQHGQAAEAVGAGMQAVDDQGSPADGDAVAATQPTLVIGRG